MAGHINDLSINGLLSKYKFSGFSSLNKYRIELHLPKGFNDNGYGSIAGNLPLVNNFVDANSTAAKLIGSIAGSNDLAATNSNSGRSKIKKIESELNKDGLINLFCETCTMPGRTLLTYDHRQLNAPYRVPYGQSQYDPLTMSFLTDDQFITRTFFETWMGAVVNIGSNTVNYYDEFVSDMRIIPITADGKDSEYYVDIFECFPLTIGQTDFGYANSDVAKIPITFSYKMWQSSTDDTSLLGFQ